MKKVTRNDINRRNMIVLSYCQCQNVLNLFAYDYKIGYNAGVYGWNYDLYRIGRVDVVTGYNVPYYQYNNKQLKNKLIKLENKVRKNKDYDNYKKFEKEFFEIFKEA